LQKFTERINNALLEKIISSFIVISGTRRVFVGIDPIEIKVTYASQYYTDRTGLRRKYAKLSIGADVLQQIIRSIKIRQAPTRHDNTDFKPILTRIAEILPLSVVTGDKAYDSEDNHILIRERLHAFSVIPTRYDDDMPICRTRGRYRKQMRRYSKVL
jgi:Transposase DDE domain